MVTIHQERLEVEKDNWNISVPSVASFKLHVHVDVDIDDDRPCITTKNYSSGLILTSQSSCMWCWTSL